MLTAFGVGFTPPIQGQAGPDLSLRAHAVDLLLPRARAPVAPLHRMRGGRQPCVVEKRQGVLQRGGTALRERLTHLGEALEAPPQVGQGVQGRLGPTAPITPGGDLDHDLAECPQLRDPPGDPPPLGAFAWAQVTLDAARPRRAHGSPRLFQPLVLWGCRVHACVAGRPLGTLGCVAASVLRALATARTTALTTSVTPCNAQT